MKKSVVISCESARHPAKRPVVHVTEYTKESGESRWLREERRVPRPSVRGAELADTEVVDLTEQVVYIGKVPLRQTVKLECRQCRRPSLFRQETLESALDVLVENLPATDKHRITLVQLGAIVEAQRKLLQ